MENYQSCHLDVITPTLHFQPWLHVNVVGQQSNQAYRVQVIWFRAKNFSNIEMRCDTQTVVAAFPETFQPNFPSEFYT